MSTLWDTEELPAKINMSVSSEDHSQLSFAAAKPRDPANIAEWSHLFYVYASIYGSYHPNEAGPMFLYMRRIQDLHRDYPNTYIWRIYDTKFRKNKAEVHSLSWHVIIPSVKDDARAAYYRKLKKTNENKAAVSGVTNYKQNQPSSHNRRRVKNSCDKWNGGSCTRMRCRFSHICSNCAGPHMITQCPTLSSRSSPPSATSTTASTSTKSKQ